MFASWIPYFWNMGDCSRNLSTQKTKCGDFIVSVAWYMARSLVAMMLDISSPCVIYPSSNMRHNARSFLPGSYCNMLLLLCILLARFLTSETHSFFCVMVSFLVSRACVMFSLCVHCWCGSMCSSVFCMIRFPMTLVGFFMGLYDEGACGSDASIALCRAVRWLGLV